MTDIPTDDRILDLFHSEATDLVQAINVALLEVEGGRDVGDALLAVLRSAHSLKGAAAAAGLPGIEDMVHAWESCIKAGQSGEVELDEHAIDILFGTLDAIAIEVEFACTGQRPLAGSSLPTPAQLAEVFGSELSSSFDAALAHAAGEPPPRSTEHAPTTARGLPRQALPLRHGVAPATRREERSPPSVEGAPPTRHELNRGKPERSIRNRRNPRGEKATGPATLRVGTAKVDRLMTSVEHLVRVKGGAHSLRSIGHLVQKLTELQELVDSNQRRRSEGRATRQPMHKQLRSRIAELIDEAATLNMLARSHSHRLAQLADTLQDDIRSVRMVPVSSILAPFGRLVRDAARRDKKLVELCIEGSDAELDRDLLEPLRQALTHLLRNAVGHGAQSAEDRRQAGKDALGVITLHFQSRGGWFEVTVADDGRGFDTARIRAAAERGGFVQPGAAELSEGEIAQLVFRSGLSTAEKVDELSGRGIGLDAVRQALENCGGSISVDSEPGRGTSFTLRLPLSVATMRVLLVSSSGEQYALALGAVERIVRVMPGDFVEVDSGAAIHLEGRAVTAVILDGVVDAAARAGARDRFHAAVVSSGAERVALLVDKVLGEQELVVKPLGEALQHVALTSGVAVTPSGDIVPLLSTTELVRGGSQARVTPIHREHATAAVASRRILIVDDSITTRTLEKSILEAVGYEVLVATDGVHALETLSNATVDLVLSDVQMPRMGGVELVERLKRNPECRHIPVVLVSSLNAEDDRKRGLEAGADAYIGKQEFRQEVLLDTIERLT